MKLENVEIKDLPAPVNKELSFDRNGLHYQTCITDDILLEQPDGTVHLNVYKEWCKVVGKVTKSNPENRDECRHIRVESKEPFLKIEALDKWEGEIRKLISVAEDCFNSRACEWRVNPWPKPIQF